jgi:tetratricopeptide (TPR) repeat protein/tRNA A-37 threonylcarbamoyl transferase component Bud32
MGMSSDKWDAAQALFEGALKREPQERAAYLEHACPGDAELRTDVLTMVALSESDREFLETPVLVQILNAPLLAQGELVADRFRIVRHVGTGGMSEVYEAEDLVHPERPERVALKIVRPGLAGVDELARRIHGEVQLAHRITHPNVCKIHSLHVDRRAGGDRLVLIMDFLDGENLRERLKRVGPLDERDAFSIAEQIAAGVDDAHREGVIHKDLKTSNVMLVPRRDGTTRAVITDFGIASSEEDAFRAGTGTDAYMAPERMIDAGATRAADIFSFGVVLYEMVTGRLPFEPGTPVDQRRKTPTVPSTIRAGFSRKWDRVILKSLHPSPAERFACASDAVDVLRTSRAWIPVAVAVVAGLLAWPLVERVILWPAVRTTTAPSAVAILPFEVVGRGGPQDGLIDYLAEQLQKSALIRSKWLVFSPRDARETGAATVESAIAAFGVTHVMTGTVKVEGQTVTVTGQLRKGNTPRPVGTFQKSCPLDNEICLQDGLYREIARVLDPQSASISQPAPISKQALPYYLQGLDYLRRDSTSYDLATGFFEQAMARDSAAVLPRLALADAQVLRFNDTRDKTALAAARSNLQDALATHADLPEVHASIGNLYRSEGRYQDAVRELQQAVQADPSNHFFLRMLGDAYDAANQEDDAVAAYEKVIALQPRYWAGYNGLAVLHYNRARFDQAATLLEQLIQWTPDHAQALTNLGVVYLALRRNTDAENVLRRACTLRATRQCHLNMGLALQRQRRTEEAIAEYEHALEFGTPSVTLLLNIADANQYRGRRSEALDYFRRAKTRAEDAVSANVQNSADRARLAYCLVQLGDRQRAEFEIKQALQHSPENRDVRWFSVLTFERLGQRDRALEILAEAPKQLLEELESAWGTEQLQQDPLYEDVARKVRSR